MLAARARSRRPQALIWTQRITHTTVNLSLGLGDLVAGDEENNQADSDVVEATKETVVEVSHWRKKIHKKENDDTSQRWFPCFTSPLEGLVLAAR